MRDLSSACTRVRALVTCSPPSLPELPKPFPEALLAPPLDVKLIANPRSGPANKTARRVRRRRPEFETFLRLAVLRVGHAGGCRRAVGPSDVRALHVSTGAHS